MMKDQRERFAKALAIACVRNTLLETIHQGCDVRSQTGDYSDVTVLTPYGEIAWNRVSRITQCEMKKLMKGVVNDIYTVLTEMEDTEFFATFTAVGDRWTASWDPAEFEPKLLKRIELMNGTPPDRSEEP